MVIYLARLTIVSPGNAVVLAPAALEGFLVGPVWYVWLGLELGDELITAATTGGTGP